MSQFLTCSPKVIKAKPFPVHRRWPPFGTEGEGSPLTMLATQWHWSPASSISSASTGLASLKHQTLVYRRDKTVPTCIHPTFRSQTRQDRETHLFSIPKHIYFPYLKKNQTCLYSTGKFRKDQVFSGPDVTTWAPPN